MIFFSTIYILDDSGNFKMAKIDQNLGFFDPFFGILQYRNVEILSIFGFFLNILKMFLIRMLLIRFDHLKRVRTPKLSGVRDFPESELNVFNSLKNN